MKVNVLRNPEKNAIMKKLRTFNDEGTIVILLRHSIREEIFDARNSKDVPLTEEGRELAIEYGFQLPLNRILRLLHSHSPRCMETASLILEGFSEKGGRGATDGAHSFLGSPFMIKPNAALGIVNELGGPGFIKAWFAGNIEESIMEPPKKATNKMMNAIRSFVNPKRAGEIQIMVTHDFTITLMIGLLFDLAKEEFKWPGYLDGVLMHFKDKNVIVFYDGAVKAYNLSDFEGKGNDVQMA